MMQKIKNLFEDELFWRVMTFMTGLFLLALPILALIFDALNRNADTALVILLAICAAFGTFLLYAATFGNVRILEKAVSWGNSGEITFILGLITFAIPITMAIKRMQHHKQRALK